MTGGQARGLRRLGALMSAAGALTLAGCATTPPPPPKIETITIPIPENIPPPEALPLPVLEPVPPELVTASRAEDLWHLRSALNVAALICDPKVHTGLIPAYNKMLTSHKALLTAAVQTELNQFKKVDAKKYLALYDTHMTKLYNQYSLTQQREKFCARSTDIASRAADMSDEELSGQATVLVFRVNLAGEIK